MRFENRADAGRRLARRLDHLRGTDAVVLGVPRGGVPVAFEVARCLGTPLDVIGVRKLGVPWQPELGFGALGEHGVRVLNQDVLRESELSAAEQETVERAERAELERRVRRCRARRAVVPLAGRTAVVVDDGMATGAAAEAACRVARTRGAARVVLAVPVGPERTVPQLRTVADQVVCLQALRHLGSIGAWYQDFSPTSDADVMTLLAEAGLCASPPPSPAAPDEHSPGRAPRAPASYERGPHEEGPHDEGPHDEGPHQQASRQPASPEQASSGQASPEQASSDREMEVPAGPVRLPARLTLPAAARAVVVSAHGGCGSRYSPSHQHVAATLQRAGLGTLVLDLLTDEEERNRHNVFDILLLARRLRAASRWLRREIDLPVSYFGAQTGAGAALQAAAEDDVRAVVSRGGRPDLAGPAALARVRAPTLFIVGRLDTRVLSLNRLAADWMRCEHSIAVVPGATHLFTEPGALETVAQLARDWFTAHLAQQDPRAAPLGTA
ncbi:phosphoribosyltransferase family protein [Streptomyces sp. NPDC046197]|uniref:phosphoribosyltransferase family protein n=1 Tax=Streptomyces sp. NPDC046197 TaxID=3154337 RepID=UPI0033EC1C28